jgi:hypothetical protein
MKHTPYKLLGSLTHGVSVICVVIMTTLSFPSLWSKLFIWSVISTTLIDMVGNKENYNNRAK